MIDLPFYYFKITDNIEKYATPLLLLGFRLTLTWIFWNAAFAKLLDWQTSIRFFQESYPVTWVPAEAWVYFFVGLELLCPILLVLGLASRIAALSLLVLTCFNPLIAGSTMIHLYWAWLLLAMVTFGPGVLSIDAAIKNHYQKHLF